MACLRCPVTARFIVGDVSDVMGTLEDRSVDLVLTSPPFLALRSYLPAGHPDKGREIGSEATPGAYIDVLLALTEEWARVLAPHGSICVELGDTYAGSDNRGTNNGNKGGTVGDPGRHDAKVGRVQTGDGWPDAKSLCLIPELYRIALVYGFNPLTGRATPRWRARNVVRWCRPNPPVGALGDKFRPATSELVVACKSTRRYFDLDAVRGPYSENTHARMAKGVESLERSGKSADRDGNWSTLPERDNDGAGAPPLDWWNIPTEPYAGSHYATFPKALLTRPILAMCPQRVCRVCGKPSERIVDVQGLRGVDILAIGVDNDRANGLQGKRPSMPDITRTTVGWSDCGHDDWRPGVVLDPFAGSGTTLAVATGHGRDAIGIDLDSRNGELAVERNGMFVTVEHHVLVVPA